MAMDIRKLQWICAKFDWSNWILKEKNVELIIRFKEGPECDLKTLKKLINLDENSFIKISKNKIFWWSRTI